MQKVLVLIPARYQSSRFPGKPLAQIAGTSMIERVYGNCAASGFDTVVVTDNSHIEEHVKDFGGRVCRVDDDVVSGSERINLAYKRHFADQGYQLIINVQGDEPLLQGKELQRLASYHRQTEYQICTLVKKMEGAQAEFSNPNRVKVIFTDSGGLEKKFIGLTPQEVGICHYFSRASIPYCRDNSLQESLIWFLHIGVYSYRPDALERFGRSQPCYCEELEKLEQLRALAMGMRIGAVMTQLDLVGVDTPEDIDKIEGVLRGQNN